MTDQSDQNTSDNLASGAAGADQEAWEGVYIDTEQLISSDQTSSGSAPSSAANGDAGSAPATDGSEPSDEEATEEAVAVSEPSTELDEPLTDDAPTGDDADGSTDHQPDSGPAAEATDDARGIYDTAPD